jgi:polyphosphate:nucleotide phosphotransferase, PPK2 family
MKLKPVADSRSIRLGDDDAKVQGKVPSGAALEAATAKQVGRIADSQRVLYADGRYALLIILQGRDASGKDGAIRKVFTAVNPQGCMVASFKPPTELEASHDFLWRVHQRVPARGMIGIFNRSHYEDIAVPRVHGQLSKKQWSARYDQINAFEWMLSENGVVILKFLLHISREEQRRRLADRLDDETKGWKFRADDLDDRARRDEFTRAYHGVLAHTSTEYAPWYIVPADDKPVRNWLIARTIADTLGRLKLRYPPIDPALRKLVVE